MVKESGISHWQEILAVLALSILGLGNAVLGLWVGLTYQNSPKRVPDA